MLSDFKRKIIVIGVGGAGICVINKMIHENGGEGEIEYIGIDTDKYALELCKASKRILIDKKAEMGRDKEWIKEIRRVAKERAQEITAAVKGADIVFVTGGMGGFTCAGVMPVAAQAAREQGILTIAAVMKPFWQIEQPKYVFDKGMKRLKKRVDTLIEIPGDMLSQEDDLGLCIQFFMENSSKNMGIFGTTNDKLLELGEREREKPDRLKKADEMMYRAIQSIVDICKASMPVHVDFADVQAALKDKGTAHVGIGTAKGESKALEASTQAVQSPLLENGIGRANCIILLISGNVLLKDIHDAAAYVQNVAGGDAQIFFGAKYDKTMEDEVRVTLLAIEEKDGEIEKQQHSKIKFGGKIQMGNHEEKITLMKKYAPDIWAGLYFHVGDKIPSDKMENAIKKFAYGLDKKSVIGFFDNTLIGSGKKGYIFTDTKICYLEALEKPQKLWYDDIKSVEIQKKHKTKDQDRELVFHMYDGSIITWTSPLLNKTPLYHFFQELLNIIHEPKEKSGMYWEDFFKMAEGSRSPIRADLNEIELQTKYYAAGSRCVEACFTSGGKGSFKYYDKNGKPMPIEVPSDAYDAAVLAMKEKINQGRINGITDSAEAEKIVKKGRVTFAQAKNIAKTGKVESVAYDAVNDAVISSSTFGISAVLTFAASIWNGEDYDEALQKAAAATGLVLFPKTGSVMRNTADFAEAKTVAGKAADTAAEFIGSDIDQMISIIKNIFYKRIDAYLLSPEEMEKIIYSLQKKADGKMQNDMFSKFDRKALTEALLTPLIETQISKRKNIAPPAAKQFRTSLKVLLEQAANTEEQWNEVKDKLRMYTAPDIYDKYFKDITLFSKTNNRIKVKAVNREAALYIKNNHSFVFEMIVGCVYGPDMQISYGFC